MGVAGPAGATVLCRRAVTATECATGPPFASNASEPGDPNGNVQVVDPTGSMINNMFDLTAVSSILNTIPGRSDAIGYVGPTWLGNHEGVQYTGMQYAGIYDGNNTVDGGILQPIPLQQADMQWVMNLTTERTHQFAVWITVGLFEVTQPGNPAVALTNRAGGLR